MDVVEHGRDDGLRHAGTVEVVLVRLFHRRLRGCAAVLLLAGAGLAGVSAVLAVGRLGAARALVFAVIAAALTGLAVAVLRARRWALWLSVVAFGGQVAGVAGTVWELTAGIESTKAEELRRLGFDPTAGVVINLVYSAVAVTLVGWLLLRWWRWRPRPMRTDDADARCRVR